MTDIPQPKDPRLGRIPEFDERSRNFPIRALIEERQPRSYTWRVGQHLDQGYEGACVGFAWAHELIARPVPIAGVTNETARIIYFEAQKIDEWDGGAYPGASEFYEGTSVLAGAKVVQRLKMIREYRWAFGLNDARLAIGFQGPVILGINWYEGMIEPDKFGYIRPTGEIVGGHAILAFSNSESKKRVTVWNSWGPQWGRDGTAYISFEDLARLLGEQGECCVPVMRRKATVFPGSA